MAHAEVGLVLEDVAVVLTPEARRRGVALEVTALAWPSRLTG